MSAIDNAFIRAYTLDTAAASAPSDRDHEGTFDSPPQAIAEPQGLLIRTSSTPRTSRRATGSTTSPARTQSAGEKPASAVLPARRSPIAVVTDAPKIVPDAVAASPVVPAPHICLASFIHTTTTLEPSTAPHCAVVLEASTPALPTPGAVKTTMPEPIAIAPVSEPSVAQLPVVQPTESEPPALESPSPEIAPSASPLELALELPSDFSQTRPSTLPFSAEVAAKSASEAEGPRAAFEVDQFAWPDLCDALLEKRAAEFDQLAGQLVTESALGRKVVAITGSRRGDGRTTLALMLARRLAATAVKVVVVDADFEVPQLAARLGMTLESGWENVLTDGLPVWDALVESLGDRVALLPLAPRPASNGATQTVAEFVAQHAEAIRQHLETLAKHFDVVLVDAGTIKAARADAKPRGPLALAGSLHAAIIVSDARVTAAARIAELHRRLQEAKIEPLGIAENFCPSKQG